MFMIIIFSIMGVIIFLMFVSGPLNPSASETPTITVANAGSVNQVRSANPFGSPENLALSPDGKTLAVATAFKILVYDLGNLEEPLFELEGQETLSRVMFSPDGQILASAGSSSDGTIWLWDMPMGGVKRAVLEGHTEAIYGIAFSPNGELLASGSRDNSVRVWDVKTGKELFFSLEHNGEVHSVAFSTDGATLASGGADGKIRLWDVESSQVKKVLDAHPSQVECLAFSPDGKLLASAGQYDTAIRLWDTQTWQPMIILRGHVESAGYGVFSLAFNDQGTLLASGGGDKSIRLWDVNPVSPSFGKKELVELQRHSDWVDSLVFSPEGVVLISASDRDGTIRIWEAGPES
jgi:WD40 repeat protein